MSVGEEDILVIESAIRGGSIALLRNGMTVAHYVGNSDVSRSEELLPNIAQLLKSAGLEKSDLNRIVVSRGPGSFTGLRIGLATAMGLAESLGIGVDGVSLLDALFSQGDEEAAKLVAVPVGRNDVAWQTSEKGRGLRSAARSERADLFVERVWVERDIQLILHSHLLPMLSAVSVASMRIVDAGENLASVIGSAWLSGKLASSGLEPIYLANSAYRA